MTKLTQIKQNEIDLSWKGHPDFVFIHTTHTALISSVYVSSQVMLYSANSIWLLQFIQKTNGKKKYWAETMCCFHVFYWRQAYRRKAENHNTKKREREDRHKAWLIAHCKWDLDRLLSSTIDTHSVHKNAYVAHSN